MGGWGEGPLDSTQGLATPGPVLVALLDTLESPCQLRFVSSASLPGLSCLFGLTHLITAIPTPAATCPDFPGCGRRAQRFPYVSRSSHSHSGGPERLSHLARSHTAAGTRIQAGPLISGPFQGPRGTLVRK